MSREFRQIEWDESVAEDCRQIIRLAVREDLDRQFDWTTLCLVSPDAMAQAAVVARAAGVACGLRAAALALAEMDERVEWSARIDDGDTVSAGQTMAEIAGPARSLLACERIVLNVIAHLSGVATLTRRYVEAVAGTRARIYDTRKTTPGWRRLEKYAVRCGGGHNHRSGLFDAILIKDNHLAVAGGPDSATRGAAEAVKKARAAADSMAGGALIVEVEVDTLEQLQEVLPAKPDLVLLDNMSPAELRRAVAVRDAMAPAIELEASGGVHLTTVAAIAETGVERISVGAVTHSAPALDIGLDWR